MASELAQVQREALRARYAFTRYQLQRHAVTEQDQATIIQAYHGCFDLPGALAAGE